MLNIGHAYSALGNKKMALDIYYMLIRSMNTGYMKRDDTIQITVMLISSAARLWGGLGQRDRAIRMCWNAIRKAKEHGLYTVLSGEKSYIEITRKIFEDFFMRMFIDVFEEYKDLLHHLHSIIPPVNHSSN